MNVFHLREDELCFIDLDTGVPSEDGQKLVALDLVSFCLDANPLSVLVVLLHLVTTSVSRPTGREEQMGENSPRLGGLFGTVDNCNHRMVSEEHSLDGRTIVQKRTSYPCHTTLVFRKEKCPFRPSTNELNFVFPLCKD